MRIGESQDSSRCTEVRACTPVSGVHANATSLDDADLLSLWALWTLASLKAHPLTLIKAAVAR